MPHSGAVVFSFTTRSKIHVVHFSGYSSNNVVVAEGVSVPPKKQLFFGFFPDEGLAQKHCNKYVFASQTVCWSFYAMFLLMTLNVSCTSFTLI